MKKQFLLTRMFLLCALIIGSVSSAWGETAGFTLSSSAGNTATGSIIGTQDETWSYNGTFSNGATGSAQYSSWQVGSGSKPCSKLVLSTSDISGTITQIDVNCGTQKSKGTVNCTVGGVNFGTQGQSAGSGNNPANYGTTPSFTGSANGEIVITINNSGTYISVKSVTVTYTVGGGSGTTTSDLALTGAPIALTFDLFNNKTAQEISYTSSSTGDISLNGNAYINYSVDTETKKISITPKAVTGGSQTITVNQAADATYAAGSATFTVTVTNSIPVITASNVNIEYNALEGNVNYSVANSVSETSLTATSDDDWISDITVGPTSVSFTTTENTKYYSRVGTITLNYSTYDSKVVTITQAGAPIPGSNFTWDLSTDNTETANENELSWTGTAAEMSVVKGESTTKANNYYGGDENNRTSTRFYKKQVLKITPKTDYQISAIIFKATSANYATALLNSEWTNATVETHTEGDEYYVYVVPTNKADEISAIIDATCGFTSVQVYVQTATVNLDSACKDDEGMYYATYSNEYAFVVPADLIVSEIKLDTQNKLVISNYETGDVVPANTGVMVSSDVAGAHTVNLSGEAGTSVLGAENLLKASSLDMTGSFKFYRLTMHEGTTIGFYWGADNGAAFTIAANKAYLAVPVGAARVAGFNLFEDEGEATAIEGVKTIGTEAPVFNLNGQRVNGNAKGLLIKNGKKFMNR